MDKTRSFSFPSNMSMFPFLGRNPWPTGMTKIQQRYRENYGITGVYEFVGNRTVFYPQLFWRGFYHGRWCKLMCVSCFWGWIFLSLFQRLLMLWKPTVIVWHALQAVIAVRKPSRNYWEGQYTSTVRKCLRFWLVLLYHSVAYLDDLFLLTFSQNVSRVVFSRETCVCRPAAVNLLAKTPEFFRNSFSAESPSRFTTKVSRGVGRTGIMRNGEKFSSTMQVSCRFLEVLMWKPAF